MYKNEGGVLALYRGIIPTVAGVAPYVNLLECPALKE
jgi:solute carrier family 25 (mitochondrial phosphate transporter), member 23/24/25/41